MVLFLRLSKRWFEQEKTGMTERAPEITRNCRLIISPSDCFCKGAIYVFFSFLGGGAAVMISELFLFGLIVRNEVPDGIPESSAMVFMYQVGQFMDDDIFDDILW